MRWILGILFMCFIAVLGTAQADPDREDVREIAQRNAAAIKCLKIVAEAEKAEQSLIDQTLIAACKAANRGDHLPEKYFRRMAKIGNINRAKAVRHLESRATKGGKYSCSSALGNRINKLNTSLSPENIQNYTAANQRLCMSGKVIYTAHPE